MIVGVGVLHGPPEAKHQHGHRPPRWRAEGESRSWSAAELQVLAKALNTVTDTLVALAPA